jgi:hypothetical protein
LSGTRFNPAVNEIHLQPRAEGGAREGAVHNRSEAGPTHLPCNISERTLRVTGAAKRCPVAPFCYARPNQ